MYRAQPSNVTLTLYVYKGNTSGPVIVGARVQGHDGAGNSFDQTTNSSGYVTITGQPGTWHFSASKNGYQTNAWDQSITSTTTRHAYLTANAPTNVTLTLYVYEKSVSGGVVPGGIPGVEVTGQDGAGNSFEQTTNSSGYVTITGQPGTWHFSASKSGYQTDTWDQSITSTGRRDALLQRKLPSSCTYTISPTSQSFGASGGSGSFNVTTSRSDCAWTAQVSYLGPQYEYWITITSGSSGTGSGTVHYTVSANSGPRTGYITVEGQQYTISQAAATTSFSRTLAVPYIHQTYDTPDDFVGSWACAPTSAVMVLAYYGRLPKDPIWVSHPSPGHYSNYGKYISREYTYGGYTFPEQHTENTSCGVATGKGAWGYIWKDSSSGVLKNLEKYLTLHGFTVSYAHYDEHSARDLVQQEIDNGRPLIARTLLSRYGHYVVIVGYEISANGNFLYKVNDPFGEKPYGNLCWGNYDVQQPVTYSYSQMGLGDPTRGLITVKASSPPQRVLQSIAASPTPVNLNIGATKQLTITAWYTDGATANVTNGATYTSSNTSVATVSSYGLITAKAAGSATITVSYTEGGATRQATVSVTVATTPSGTTKTHTFYKGWNLVSLPLTPSNPSPSAVFDEVTGTLYLYQWNPNTGTWKRTDKGTLTTVGPTGGYWLWLPTTTTVSVTGVLVTGDQTKQLGKKGWQMIGVPYQVAWGSGSGGSISVTNGSQAKTLAEAVTAGWIYDTIWAYDTSSKSWIKTSVSAGTTLDPWKGYWIYTYVGNLELRFSQTAGPGGTHPSPSSAPHGLIAPMGNPPVPGSPISLQTDELVFGNSPNPVTDIHTTTFEVKGAAAALVDAIKVQIFDLSGRLVYESGEIRGKSLDWHTENHYGDILANGVYLYKMYAKIGDEWIESKTRKLVILR